jgi:hypothetical protein
MELGLSHQEGLDISTLFDNNYYLARYADVKAAVERGNYSTGLEHFLKFGQFENRDPSPFFDTKFYLEHNPDVKAAVEKDPRDALT